MSGPADAPHGWRGAPAGPIPSPSLRHLKALLGPFGLFEHACYENPRPANGYCTDDAGRALALACRLPSDPDAEELAQVTLGFLERAHAGEGRFHLRLGPEGRWSIDPPSEDAAGRALLGLGVAASSAPWPPLRERAEALFVEAAGLRCRARRAASYALIGATDALAAPETSGPVRQAARRLVERLAPLPLGRGPASDAVTAAALGAWPWPEPRLSYANALLPHASMAAAAALGDDGRLRQSLELLCWLVEEESLEGRFSFSPVGGRGPREEKPAFDQQPIEAAAMAHACACALALSMGPGWEGPFWAAVAWFLGENDAGARMWDPATGGAYDGLRRSGVNYNQGTESTIAFVSTMALARRQAAAASADSSSDTDAVAAPT